MAKQRVQREADFIPVVAWRKLGETVAQHLTKGRLVAVEGRLQLRSYQRQDESTARVAEVIASGVRFLPDGKGRANGHVEEEHPGADEGGEQD